MSQESKPTKAVRALIRTTADACCDALARARSRGYSYEVEAEINLEGSFVVERNGAWRLVADVKAPLVADAVAVSVAPEVGAQSEGERASTIALRFHLKGSTARPE